jgi:hypothetical protein
VLVPDDNPNHARVRDEGPSVPVGDYLFLHYADYLDTEYGDLDNDFVFVNLWRGQRGAAMTYGAGGICSVVRWEPDDVLAKLDVGTVGRSPLHDDWRRECLHLDLGGRSPAGW